MGSKWILHLLNNVSQEWKDVFIKCWISIAPVYEGSPKILKSLISGDNAGINFVLNYKVIEIYYF